MDLENNFDFYATRDEKVETLLNQEYDDWNFSDSEKTFWLNRVSSVSTPYEYSYHTGWETLLSCLELFVIGIIGICICVAGTFPVNISLVQTALYCRHDMENQN